MGYYDTAQICLNGHVINSTAQKYPQSNKKFCQKCGSATIIHCKQCSTLILGDYVSEEYPSFSNDYIAPSFCQECGKPFPWTEARILAISDLIAELDELSPEEKSILNKSIDDIVRDTPQTTVAATRFKKILSKAGKAAVETFKVIAIDIISETAKKTLFGS